MAKRGKEKAGLILRKTTRGIFPVSAFDAEQLDHFPVDTEFSATPLTKRSTAQNRTYWRALSEVVKATGVYPTAEHLHEELKRDLGYVAPRKSLIGTVYLATDSTAFDAMTAGEFQIYMDQAMARLAEVCGFDPLGFLEAA
jgi:hypothetical protein